MCEEPPKLIIDFEDDSQDYFEELSPKIISLTFVDQNYKPIKEIKINYNDNLRKDLDKFLVNFKK